MEMVVVATASTRFEADLYAAKLGAHGLLWEIRSRELVPTTHPIGWLEVLVPALEHDDAREVLAVDAPDESDWSHDGPHPSDRRRGPVLTPGLRVLRAALAAGLLLPSGLLIIEWLLGLLDVVR
jgi:hypothetical protein